MTRTGSQTNRKTEAHSREQDRHTEKEGESDVEGQKNDKRPSKFKSSHKPKEIRIEAHTRGRKMFML